MARENPEERARKAADALRAALKTIDLACAGTITVRTKMCGNHDCACRRDREARHGPYREWTRVRDGRLAHTNLTEEQAAALAAAIADYRKIRRILTRWERATEAVIVGADNRKLPPKRKLRRD
jgi:hypothetical protein